jgi:predicted metal-dependent peptidase
MKAKISDITKIVKPPKGNKPSKASKPSNVKIVPISPPNQDDRYVPNESEGKTKEEQQKQIEDTVQRAYDQQIRDNQGGSMGGSGSGSGVGSLFKRDLLKTKTDWKALTKNFVGGLPRVEQNWNRPASRYWAGTGIYMPSEKLTKDSLDLVVAVDTSGSIATRQIHAFLNEVVTLAASRKNVKLKVLFWMNDVYVSQDLDSKKMSLAEMQSKFKGMPIRNDGGTTISCVKTYLEKEGIKKIEGLIYFTDGYVESTPQIPRVQNNRILFMITPGGTTQILSKYGRTVEVDIK